jgi:hypothetical protein
MATESNRGGAKSRAGSAKKAAAAALSPDTLIDIVQRLGVVDIAVERMRSRIEDVDFDDLLDEAGRYVRRNPEVVVIGLGVLTIAAAAVVYLDHRLDDERRWGAAIDEDYDDDDDEELNIVAVKPAPRTVTSAPGKSRPATVAPTRRRNS